eukprot:2168362-Pyramimonas_sp.AAC.1
MLINGVGDEGEDGDADAADDEVSDDDDDDDDDETDDDDADDDDDDDADDDEDDDADRGRGQFRYSFISLLLVVCRARCPSSATPLRIIVVPAPPRLTLGSSRHARFLLCRSFRIGFAHHQRMKARDCNAELKVAMA